ncbi:MAG TPA: hypothetical protein VGG28_25115, partial [Kofleriaceae bacterium]
MEFPAFLFGNEEAVIERAELEGNAWLTSWRQTGALPDGALDEIGAGELVIVHHGTLDPFTHRWMLFGVEFAMTAVSLAVDDAERSRFEEFVGATPWGALATCTRLRRPNTIETVTRRARRLLAQWEPLTTLRYIGAPKRLPEIVTFPALNQSSIELDELVSELFTGPLAMWGPQLGSVRLRLESALEAMAAASADEARAKLLRRMVELARQNKRLQG